MIGVGGGVALASHNFSGVSTGSWYHDSVDFLQSREITGGCEGGVGNKFCPDRNVTRAEMSAFLAKNARVLSPMVRSTTDSGFAQDENACILGPFVPDFEMTAVFDGGMYATGPGLVDSRVQVRANGGAWIDAWDSWWMPMEAASDEYGNSPLVGNQDLNRGSCTNSPSMHTPSAEEQHRLPADSGDPPPEAGNRVASHRRIPNPTGLRRLTVSKQARY